jgi:hypothetical protein
VLAALAHGALAGIGAARAPREHVLPGVLVNTLVLVVGVALSPARSAPRSRGS